MTTVTGPAAVMQRLRPSQMQAMLTDLARAHPEWFRAAVKSVDDETGQLTYLLGESGARR